MNYHSVTSFEEAARIAYEATGTTRFLAGGTDVLVQMRAGSVLPDDVIDIKAIPGAHDIVRARDGGWRIGIAVSGIELGAHSELRAEYPGVVEGMEMVGSTQIQGRATLTGNLCNGSPAADSVPGLVAANATVVVVGPAGARELAVEAVPSGPGTTILAKGELISEIRLPPRATYASDAYLRLIPRTEMDVAVVGCAVNISLDGYRISAARVALGAVAPTVILATEAADCIIGTRLDNAALNAMEAAVKGAALPISDKRGTADYRTEMAGVLARRAARIAYIRAQGDTP